MPKRREDPKEQSLRRQRTLHPQPSSVSDPLFESAGFFDRRDLLQVKYEMLRSVRVEQSSVSDAATRFGLSRPTYYQANEDFERAGLPGLLPAPKGPRRSHKLSAEVMSFVLKELDADGGLDATALALRIKARFKLSVHPRSVQRALERAKKAVAAK